MRATIGLRSFWTDVDGWRVHARAPAAPAPPGSASIVLVHGLGVSSRYMVPLAHALAARSAPVAVDLPGYGRSQGPRNALGLTQLADALATWMTNAQIKPDVLVGNSMGCQILVELARRHPSRVPRLVLVGPTMDPAARTARQQLWRLLVDTFREAPSQPFVVAYDYMTFGLRRFRQTFWEAAGDHVECKLADVTAPSLVVRGERDPIVPQRWAEEVARRLPAGRLVVVSGAAHSVNYQRPGVLANLILEFVSGPA